MSDYDPNRMDPNRPPLNEADYSAARPFNWNWVIGGIAAIVVLIVALSFVGRDDRTADTGQPPATTGQSTPTNPAPSAAPKTTPAPAATPNRNPMPAERTAPPSPPSSNQ